MPQQPTMPAGFVPDGFEPDTQVAPMNRAMVNGQPVSTEDDNSFVSHFADQVNPLPLGQLLPFPQSLGGAGMAAPLKAAHNVLQAQGALFDKAKSAYEKGDYVGAAAHSLNWLLPVLGPVLDKAGEEMKAGKFKAAAGDTMGLVASLFGPQMVGDAATAVKGTSAAEKVADVAEKGAQARAVETMAPQVGANKVRFGNMAADVGADTLRQTTAKTRGGLLDQASVKLEESYAALDDAADSRLNAKTFPTQPIIDDLLAKRAKLTAKPVDASRTTQTVVAGPEPPAKFLETPYGSQGLFADRPRPPQRTTPVMQEAPIGEEVVPGPNAARVAEIDKAISEIKQLGPVARYEPLRIIRQAYDGPAKAVYSPAMTADYMKAQGGKLGAADVTGTLRDSLAKFDPQTAAVNADASFWKKAVDVLTAAEESDRVRPKVGRSILARGLGAAAGGEAGGLKGAIGGAVIGPAIERGLSNLSPTTKIVVGRQMARLADALRAGDTGAANSAMQSIRAMLRAGATKVGQLATQPTGQQAAPGTAAP